MNRKIQPDVQAVFDKYVSGATRRLGKDSALNMLVTEFGIERKWAEHFFKHFDADSNEVLSLWKFQHFYNVVGKRAPEIVARFGELDTNTDDLLEPDDVRAEIAQMKSPAGEPFSEKEVNFFMKGAVGDQEEKINIGQFADLLYRIQAYKKPQKRG